MHLHPAELNSLGVEYDWSYGEGHSDVLVVFVVTQLRTGLSVTLRGAHARIADKAIGQALLFLRPTSSLENEVFRGIEYRAIRDVVLARLFEVGRNGLTEAGQ